ncbi:MAG: hypothetical protein KGM92_17160 [Acidobacteriota bacterium]|nr:hypothetical protein [Acidobacteriota bacterium]
MAAITSVNNAGSWDWSEREVRRQLVFVDIAGSQARGLASSSALSRLQSPLREAVSPISSDCWPENLAMDKLFWL